MENIENKVDNMDKRLKNMENGMGSKINVLEKLRNLDVTQKPSS